MTSTSRMSVSRVSQTLYPNQNQKVGVIMRRPTQNLTFAQKKTQAMFITDAIFPSKQRSKEKTRSEIGGLQHQQSLQQIKSCVYQKMSFLSPKNQTQSKVLNIFPAPNNERSPRFCRKKQFELRKSTSGNFLVKYQNPKSEDTFENGISKISLEFLNNKDEILQTQPQTMDDFYYKSRQILELREQNVNLKHEVQVYKVKCNYLEEKLAKHESQSRINAVFVNKCNFCTLLEQQIIKKGRQTGILEIQLAQKDKQLQKLKKQLIIQKEQFEKISIKYAQLQRQFQIIHNKQRKEQRIRQQLSDIINSLNEKLGNTSDQIRYLKIQQNIMLKKNYQCDKVKTESTKLSTQNQALRKVVTQYKEKLDVIRKLHNKKKINRQKSKEIYYQDLFYLSSQHSED